MDFLQFMVPRLNGISIERDFKKHLGLVKKGVAGFIVFGGELNALRKSISRLQEASMTPLIISSDLERGLGQQVKGGTVFPPAMALSNVDSPLRRAAFRAIAKEAAYVGINAIFAPVLDINTNPDNPIIATRAFGEDPKTVSKAGVEMIKEFRKFGIASCGKHFPGHGDTAVDSHIGLPVVERPLSGLEACELVPFKHAFKADVDMIMLGHLSVPSLDPSGLPASLSKKTVNYLRKNMGYRGIVITDAMNMGGLSGLSEPQAALLSLKAGVDIILHPSDPQTLDKSLRKSSLHLNPSRLLRFRKGLITCSYVEPDWDAHEKLSVDITEKSIKPEGHIKPLKRPFLLILNDDKGDKGAVFVKILSSYYPNLKSKTVSPLSPSFRVPTGHDLVVAIFSPVKAWKGGASGWLKNTLDCLSPRADVLISFGSPYLIRNTQGPLKVYAYWEHEKCQKASALILSSLLSAR